MDRSALLDYFELENAILIDLCAGRAARLDAPAPACAPLTGADLVVHLGRIYTGAQQWILEGRRPLDWPGPPVGGDPVDWMTGAAHELIGVLLKRSERSNCATWCATERSAGFWFRRMAHETAVHRVDIAQALGEKWTVDDSLAVDGIAEALELWLGTQLGNAIGGTGRTVRLDAETHQWWVRPFAHLIDYPTGGPADATVSGDNAGVWAWVWGRTDEAHPVEITGDVAAAHELRALFARAQQ